MTPTPANENTPPIQETTAMIAKPNRVQVMSENQRQRLRCAVCEERIQPGEHTRYSPTDGSTIHDSWCPSRPRLWGEVTAMVNENTPPAELVERVARAMALAEARHDTGTEWAPEKFEAFWQQLGVDGFQDEYFRHARAALAALPADATRLVPHTQMKELQAELAKAQKHIEIQHDINTRWWQYGDEQVGRGLVRQSLEARAEAKGVRADGTGCAELEDAKEEARAAAEYMNRDRQQAIRATAGREKAQAESQQWRQMMHHYRAKWREACAPKARQTTAADDDPVQWEVCVRIPATLPDEVKSSPFRRDRGCRTRVGAC